MKPLPASFALEAEIDHAVIVAVDYAWKRDWHCLWIEEDSAFV